MVQIRIGNIAVNMRF